MGSPETTIPDTTTLRTSRFKRYLRFMTWIAEFVIGWIWEDLILAAHKKWDLIGGIAAFLLPVVLFCGAIGLVLVVA